MLKIGIEEVMFKMKKGISPVVAVVLLIAIAVIASVGVWYWIGEFTDKPSVAGADKSLVVIECSGTAVFIQNIGNDKLDGSAAFFDGNNLQIGVLNFSAMAGGGIDVDDASWVDLYNMSGDAMSTEITGEYFILESGYQQVSFNC